MVTFCYNHQLCITTEHCKNIPGSDETREKQATIVEMLSATAYHSPHPSDCSARPDF